MDNEKDKKTFKLLLMEKGWGNLHLTISNIEILDDEEHTDVGTLNYDLGGYTPEDLEAIGKTEEELIVYCNDTLLEILEQGLNTSAQKVEDDVLEKLRKEI